MKFLGKWAELQAVILTEVTQIEKTSHICSLLFVDLSPKSLHVNIYPDVPTGARKWKGTMLVKEKRSLRGRCRTQGLSRGQWVYFN